MKRHAFLFERIVAFDNLLLAARHAASGKKDRIRVAHFLFHLETELLWLQEELKAGIWRPGPFRVFEIREPKPRRISAADFRDRVLHHAICNIIGPIFEKRAIHDSWACRTGKGSHGAVLRAQGFARRHRYFLKCDIRRYFESVDHAILKRLLRRILKDGQLLELLDRIIDHAPPGSTPGKGLPIGNLTSQHFANLYLGELDHEMKDHRHVRAYIRYMDDMLLFADDKEELRAYLQHLDDFARDRLALSLKPSATIIAPVSDGVPFLGFRVFPNLIRLQRKSLTRFRRRLRSQEGAYLRGDLDIESLTCSIQSMIAHMSHADTLSLRRSLLQRSLSLG
ncbi:MAG: reverse transcriptase domain-containing protein [Pseudomonadota bacterium]